MYRCLGLLVFVPVLCGGCAATADLAGGDKVLKFHVDDEPVLEKVRHSGDYVVVYRERATGELWSAYDSRRALKKGDDIGFTRDEAGKLVAIGGTEQRTLGHIPVTAQYAAWYRLPNDYDRRRQFGKGLNAAANLAVKTAVVGGAVLGVAAVESAAEDGSGDDDSPKPHKHRRD